jgi:hypothetical protein
MAISHTEALMLEAGLTDKDISLPLGNVAIFGQSGTGKTSLLFGSKFVQDIIIADMGSMAHRLYTPNARFTIISPDGKHRVCHPGKPDQVVDKSPIDMVRMVTDECRMMNRMSSLDSWSTLQEHEVAYTKNISGKRGMSLPMHNEVVGRLRDLALFLAASPGFTIFNTSPGGEGKTPTGEVVKYPKGCITGYPSLNGTESGKETILARWSSVWGVFKGYGEIPRGLFVPSHDIRPQDMQNFSPLKDPYLVITDTSDNEKHIMTTFDLRDQRSIGRCFIDEMLILIAKRLKDVSGQRQAIQPPQSQASTQAQHESHKQRQESGPANGTAQDGKRPDKVGAR